MTVLRRIETSVASFALDYIYAERQPHDVWAESLTPERRREIAQRAAQARSRQVSPAERAALPSAKHEGPLTIADDLVLPSAVLSDETRVIAENAVAKQLGRGLGGKTLRLAARDKEQALPAYLTTTLEPFVPESLRAALNRPIMFRGRAACGAVFPQCFSLRFAKCG